MIPVTYGYVRVSNTDVATRNLETSSTSSKSSVSARSTSSLTR